MTIMYKLTTQDLTTHNGMKWAIGKTNTATGSGDKMCTDGVLHCYADPRLAIIFNPTHADIKNPRLFKIKCSSILSTDGLKHCSKQQTPVVELTLPKLSTNQIVAFAIKAALTVCKDESFSQWAENWLSGADRSADAARAAARAVAYAAAYAADAACAAYAAYAADAARSADASYAACAACAAYAADAACAAYAADAACAARSADAACAADAAARAAKLSKSFVKIIDWVALNIS